jgi:hypothetical protein
VSAASREALFRRNAEACENARFSKCVCACGGALHGKVHSEGWQRQTFARLEAERPASPPALDPQDGFDFVMGP